jgi:heat shock 70kDa protein 4
MVGFGPCRKMGEEASIAVGSNFRNTVTGAMKRLVGLEYNNPVAKEEMERYKGLLTFCPVPHAGENKADSIGVQVEFNETTTVLPIEQVAGMMITHMGQIVAAKVAQGTPNAGSTDSSELTLPSDWVIAIPNYWTDAQRRSLLTGCEIVGITGVQRLMHENTATALAYGIFKDLRKEFSAEKPTQVMFIDMGASSYTVSIAAFHPGKLHVLTSHCDSGLGGRDFDLLIAEWIASKFEEKYKSKLSGKPMDVPKTKIKLLAAAEKAKKTLSPKGVTEARLNLEMLQDDLDFSITLKAEEYEELCKPLLARLNKPIQACLDEAKIASIADIDKVEVVGGSTRIGCVTRHIKAAFGIETLYTTMNADEAVARGAALQSAILSPRFKVLPYDIEEAQPYPIQIAWTPAVLAAAAAAAAESSEGAAGGEPAANSVVMFDRGLSFPIVRRVTLKRQGDFQVEALYDDSAARYELDARQNKSIATFHIKAVPNTSGEKKVRVNVKQDIHGIIHLSSAQMVEEIDEESTGDETKDPPADAASAACDESKKEGGDGAEGVEKKKKVKKTNLDFTISRPLEWTRDEIFRANEIEVSMANTDRIVRETSNMRNELESYIYDMRDKVVSDSHLGLYGTDSEKSAFTSLSEQTENWLYEEGFNATKSTYAEKLDALRKLGQPMEARQVESSGRAAAVSALQANLDIYKKWVNESQTLSNYTHITDEERQTVDKKCDEISGWMYEMLDRQGNCAPHEDAVLTVQDLDSKNRSLTETCGAIMKKPIPAPAPAPAPMNEEAAANDGAKKEDPPASGEAMDVDGQTATNGGNTTPTDMEVET